MKRDKWQPEEIETLRQRYPHVPTADLAREMDRTLRTVYKRANKLGLHKTAVFVKQLGKWITGDHTGRGCTGFDTGFVVNRWLLDDGRVFVPPVIGANAHVRPDNAIAFGNCDDHGGNWIEWPLDLRIREFPAEVTV